MWVYRVPAGTWIEVRLTNNGETVDIELASARRNEYEQTARHRYGLRLWAGEEHYMGMIRVRAHATDVRVLDGAHNPVLRMRFESGGESMHAAVPDTVGCWLAELRACV